MPGTSLGGVPVLRPLSGAHDRAAFDCGRASLNAWFVRHALANHRNNVSRVTVLPEAVEEAGENEASAGRIVGYFALSAAQIERAHLLKAERRNRPDPLPVFLLGQLAVDRRFQGQGHATLLLGYALQTAVRGADLIGSMGVITHPLDDELRRFYARWGFEDLPYDPRRAMIVRMKDLRQNGFGAQEDL